ncbi:MAG: ABC transporter permease [Carboxylicivirga sp.]|jgi:putative ABC transport system permease protein|nr:ABC transporter permease [Carboxylicivirga sp.]
MLYTIKLAIRKLFTKGQYTFTRIISLAVGLAFGMLLLSEVFYFYSYDNFYPDANRLYCIESNYRLDQSSDKFSVSSHVSGGVALGMKSDVPGVEAATRLNSIYECIFYTSDKKRHQGNFAFADPYLFDVLPRPMVNGNAVKILSTPMACMVSAEVAKNMGGNVIGKQIELKRFPGKKLSIQGVFESLPDNTNFNYDVLISMISTSEFMWDGSEYWLGNDRYFAVVKLAKGVDPKSLTPAMRQMQIKYQDIEKIEAKHGGVVIKYTLEPLTRLFSNDMRDMIIILATIALAVLFVSLLNYILLTLSSLVAQAKSSAIFKSCGAHERNIRQLIFIESILMFIISVAGAFGIIGIVRPYAESQLEHSLQTVINPDVILPLLLILIVLLALTSYLPARFFSRIPVTAAFRSYNQNKNKWKLALLAFQFVGASFIIMVMLMVTLQYNNMINAPHGYNHKGIYYGSTTGMTGSKVTTVMNELKNIPGVEMVGVGQQLPIERAAGNNVLSPDREKELFNIADFYNVDENYLSIFNIPVKQGHDFSMDYAVKGDILISEKAAAKLILNNAWEDGVLGKDISITEHGATTIRGVFPDFIMGSVSSPDLRPAVFFYLPHDQLEKKIINEPSDSYVILVKVNEAMETGMKEKIAKVFNIALPLNDAEIYSFEEEFIMNYKNEKGFRDMMLAGNFIILLITGIGLLGYTTHEALRRQKELAIRKINGASLTNIVRVFIIDLQYIALPSVAIGLVGAWFTLERWMQNFAFKIPLHWGIFTLCGLLMLTLVSVVAIVNFVRIGNRNPVEALRYE